MSGGPDLAKLARLAGMLSDARLAELGRVKDRVAGLRQRRATLVPEPGETCAELLRHAAWIQQERAALAGELTRLAEAESTALAQARDAFGCAEVLRKMAAATQRR